MITMTKAPIEMDPDGRLEVEVELTKRPKMGLQGLQDHCRRKEGAGQTGRK